MLSRIDAVKSRARGIALAFLAMLSAASASAAPCVISSPFTDVPLSAIFCYEATWLRNANVTLGCGAGTTYCPNDPVTRAQMALFMKRLARAVTPDIVYADVPAPSGDLDGGGYATCVAAPYTVPTSVRLLAFATGTVSILTDAPADILVAIQFSIDGGLFTTFVGNVPRVLVPANQWTVVPIMGGYNIQGGLGLQQIPGQTLQFRILLERVGGSTTGEVTSHRCQMMIHLPIESADEPT